MTRKQTFHKGDIVRVANHYPWIRENGKIVAHHTGHGETATVVGSYADQYPDWNTARQRKIYTLKFKRHGTISWYDEAYLTLVTKGMPNEAQPHS